MRIRVQVLARLLHHDQIGTFGQRSAVAPHYVAAPNSESSRPHPQLTWELDAVVAHGLLAIDASDRDGKRNPMCFELTGCALEEWGSVLGNVRRQNNDLRP
jgi:hypothetical protein